MKEDADLEATINYMKAHWPSQVKPEWQVPLEDYVKILPKVITDFTTQAGFVNNDSAINPSASAAAQPQPTPATTGRRFIRIAGLSGSGKTSQILPAVEAYCNKQGITPVLVAARRFVVYHPHKQEIENFYGPENLRKMTDEFSTIMMFMTLKSLSAQGYDIVLDVTLLDPTVEKILMRMLGDKYQKLLLMIATSPDVTERFLQGRSWRHSKETELEFIRATEKALKFYAENYGHDRIILWSVYDEAPVYDGAIEDALEVFHEYSAKTAEAPHNEDARRTAKIKYLENLPGAQ